jgi:hypothetical protein
MLGRIRVSARASAAVLVLATGAAAGCGSGGPAVSASHPGSAGSAASASASASAARSTAVAGCDSGPWRAAPVTVTHQVPVPPVPVITAVRVAQHPECGYDRVVLDLSGPVPGYSVRYVSDVTTDSSGRTITLPGSRYLLITLRPAQAHSDAGTPTVTTGVRQAGYPALASWALTGDVEGVVRIALGLTGPKTVRVGELPSRIYVDVRE